MPQNPDRALFMSILKLESFLDLTQSDTLKLRRTFPEIFEFLYKNVLTWKALLCDVRFDNWQFMTHVGRHWLLTACFHFWVTSGYICVRTQLRVRSQRKLRLFVGFLSTYLVFLRADLGRHWLDLGDFWEIGAKVGVFKENDGMWAVSVDTPLAEGVWTFVAGKHNLFVVVTLHFAVAFAPLLVV